MTDGRSLTRRRLMMIACGAAVLGEIGKAEAGAGKRPVVVELFTSQGCSSCPEADAVLGELTRKKGVLALSLNVDYWDYLGWRDTLGSPDHTSRQRAYAQRRGDGQVYTPQMVFNGKRHLIGSRRKEVLGAIAEEAAVDEATTVGMRLREHGGEIVIEVDGAPTDRLRQDSTIWLLTVAPKVGVTIERGENTGRTIDYYNVVRKSMPAGMWHGEAVELKLPRADLMTEPSTAIAALLQIGGTGPIIGAAWMPGPES